MRRQPRLDAFLTQPRSAAGFDSPVARVVGRHGGPVHQPGPGADVGPAGFRRAGPAGGGAGHTGVAGVQRSGWRGLRMAVARAHAGGRPFRGAGAGAGHRGGARLGGPGVHGRRPRCHGRADGPGSHGSHHHGGVPDRAGAVRPGALRQVRAAAGAGGLHERCGAAGPAGPAALDVRLAGGCVADPRMGGHAGGSARDGRGGPVHGGRHRGLAAPEPPAARHLDRPAGRQPAPTPCCTRWRRSGPWGR
jgi:hypothetical protein